MPRDGSNVYHRPSGTDGIPNTPVQSAPYNTYTADIEQDLNLPRPIVAGGTAATSADVALLNLSAEKFKQVVTNWDSMVWLAGSFYAATTASGTAPVAAHAFAGVVYYANATDFVLQAVDLTDANHPQFIRVMSGGVWGAWAADDASVYVKKAGDTMTGDLTINSAFLTVSAAAPSLNLTKAASGNASGIMSRLGAALRWIILPGDTTAESGSNVGSDFVVQAYTDAAAPVTPPAITIKRALNRVILAGDPVAALDAVTKQYSDLHALIASPALTGNPTAPTPAAAGNDTSIATTAFVSASAIRYDLVQSLSAGQQLQARINEGALGSVVVRTFTASGTYTPTPGMVCAIIECVGGGGSGGNTTGTAAGQLSASGGGGGGAYARTRVTAAAVGASQVVTVGAGAAATGGAGNPGGAGTASSVGALCSAGGGGAGQGSAAATATYALGGAGGTPTIGDIGIKGSAAQAGVSMGSNVLPSMGGASGCGFGAGGSGLNAAPGGAGSAYGGGGGGTALAPSSSALSGGAGAAGIVIITEFLP